MRLAPALAALVLLTVAGGATLPPPSFRYGVSAGEVTATSAILWTQGPAGGPVELQVSGSRSFEAVIARRVAEAGFRNAGNVQVRVADLSPGTRYWYRFLQGELVSPAGTFETAPRSSANVEVRFAVSGDADATLNRNGKPAFHYRVYSRMVEERNDFNINLGDTIYSDSEVAGAPIARNRQQKWGKYGLGLSRRPLRDLRASAGLYSHWDDHEFVNDFSRPEHGDAIYRAGVRAFRDFSPVAYSSSLGLYRSVRWGKNLELFFLDERSFRSAKASTTCNGDLAPTVPQAVRERFAPLAPALRNPVPPACLAALDDPARTMLGAAQYAAFTKAIKASRATWKVIVNEVPIQQYYALPYDRWEGYAAERERLLRFLQANVKNVVFLATDTHANLVNEVRYKTFASPPEGTGIWEVVTGPVATNTFATEIDGFLGTPGAGTAIGALFFKPPPPSGLGMRCAALDTYSYAQVTVTARRLTIALKDSRGRQVREATGVTCAPLVLTAR